MTLSESFIPEKDRGGQSHHKLLKVVLSNPVHWYGLVLRFFTLASEFHIANQGSYCWPGPHFHFSRDYVSSPYPLLLLFLAVQVTKPYLQSSAYQARDLEQVRQDALMRCGRNIKKSDE